MNYKKYQEGGPAPAPKMTQSLANVLGKIQAEGDKRKILEAEQAVKEKLQDEITKAEEIAQQQDLYSAIGKIIGGYGASGLMMMSDKTKRFAPIAGAAGDIAGSLLGREVAKDYTMPDIEDLDIDVPQTMFYSDQARMLEQTGESGLEDILDQSKKSKKELRDKILLSAFSSLPVYGEVSSGKDWLATLFGRNTDDKVDTPNNEPLVLDI